MVQRKLWCATENGCQVNVNLGGFSMVLQIRAKPPRFYITIAQYCR